MNLQIVHPFLSSTFHAFTGTSPLSDAAGLDRLLEIFGVDLWPLLGHMCSTRKGNVCTYRGAGGLLDAEVRAVLTGVEELLTS